MNMADTKTIINSIGILATIIGVYMVYLNSPINIHTIGGGKAYTDFTLIEKQANRANFLLRAGVYVVMAGSALQLVSNFLAAG